MILKSSIGTKLSIWITILIALSLSLFSFFSFFQLSKIINLKIEEKAIVLTKNLTLNSQYAIKQGDIKNLQSLTDSILSNSDVVGSEIRDTAGELLAYTYTKEWETFLKKKELVGDINSDTSDVSVKHIVLNNNKILEVRGNIFFQSENASSFFENTQRVGTAILYLSTNETVALIRKLKFGVFFVSVIVLTLSFLLTVVFVKRFTRALQDLVVGTLELKQGNLDYRVKNRSKDEIGQLAMAFNSMSADLKVKMQQLDKLNKELELRVEKRTEELKQVNLQLRDLQDDVMNSAKLAAVGEMSSKIIDDISKPLMNLMLVFHNQMSKTILIERKDAVKSLKSVLLLWQKKYRDGELAALLATVKDGHQLGERTFELLIASFDLLVQREDKALDLFNYLERETMHIFAVAKDLKESLTLDKPIEQVDVIDILDEVIAALGAKIKKQTINIERNYPDESLFINVCVEDIMQVFFNILLNSLQSFDGIASKPKISITVTLVEGMVEIKISDNGCGIAQEHQDKIFNPGFSTKSGEVGVGFGLAICRRYIANYNGEIILKKSEPLLGTTFVVILPADNKFINWEEAIETKME